MKCVFRLSLLVSLVVLDSRLASAGSIAITNASFESPSTTTQVVGFVTGAPVVDGWNLIVNTGSYGSGGGVYNPYQFQGPNAFYLGANNLTNPANGGSGFSGIVGENLAFIYQVNAGSGFSQTLGAVLTANTSYTLTVAEGHRNGTSNGAATLGSQIKLFAGNTLIASSTDHTGPVSGTFADQTAILADSSLFSSLYGQTLSIEILTTQNWSTTNQASDWDNVRLEATTVSVPEPRSILLAGVGALGLIAWSKYRRQVKIKTGQVTGLPSFKSGFRHSGKRRGHL